MICDTCTTGAHLVQEEAERGLVLLVHGARNDVVRLVVVLVGVTLQPAQDVVAADDVLAPGDAICGCMQLDMSA